jgi:hypothetical protein
LLVLIRIFQFSEVIFVLLSLLFYCRAPTPGGGVVRRTAREHLADISPRQ